MSALPRAAEVFRAARRRLLPPAAALALLVCLVASPAAARAQVFITPNIVISQIYTHGGEPGATFQSDYVELFNRGCANININGFALQTTTGNGNFRRRGGPAGPTTRCR